MCWGRHVLAHACLRRAAAHLRPCVRLREEDPADVDAVPRFDATGELPTQVHQQGAGGGPLGHLVRALLDLALLVLHKLGPAHLRGPKVHQNTGSGGFGR